ncbi:MAG: site-specific DNA-methyltransferase [Chlorobiaceae bacterium]|nr:site-specific DNA-methyltransferase [Chlorobiaceae bacterium]
MNQNYEKLKALLKELFQLDQPDLDFGLYRIMHAKSAEVTQFLDKDLFPQVKAAFSQYKSADKAEIEKELNKVIAGVEAAGMYPEDSPKVQALREQLQNDAVDTGTLESEVYDHLFSFFRRYYSEGDFLAKRVYKPGVYAIPYEGEEVTLHWANKDQYYIKTSEYLRDYAFRLHPDSEQNPMRVHFRLADVAEGEHGNVKVAEGKDRRFRLAEENTLSVEDGELIIRFTYQPDPAKQKELNSTTEETILAAGDALLMEWITELRKLNVRSDGSSSGTRLRLHLDRYTARNTFDYFIHKDLGTFLRRELDFFIKNEVMHLDDVENETVSRVEQYLSKIKVIRKIGGKIIDFLAQLEEFQKKLWLKKKFVVETNYCITLDRIPEEFYPEIAASQKQWEQWRMLEMLETSSVDKPGLFTQAAVGSVEYLKAHPFLMVDTSLFDAAFKQGLLSAIDNLDESLDGLLIHGDNFHGLSLLQLRYREQVKCVYIDPPYNTEGNAILYKNTYRHSSWVSLMETRLKMSLNLEIQKSGVHVVAIDETEQSRLFLLLSEIASGRTVTTVSIIHNPGGTMGKNFSSSGEYALFLYDGNNYTIAQENRSDDPDVRDLMNTAKGNAGNHLRSTGKTCFYPILVRDMQIVGFGDICDDDFHPLQNEKRPDGIVEVYPIDADGNERKWVLGRSTVEDERADLFPKIDSKTKNIRIERRKSAINYKTVWTDGKYSAKKYGTELLGDIIPETRGLPRLYPKSLFLVKDCLHAGIKGNVTSTILDYFAGSGTTGHAVIALNRQDQGNRKYILIEQGEYFDTVLKPRIQKVVYSEAWKEGKATAPQKGISHAFKVVKLESYEDTLNNLELKRTNQQQLTLDSPEAQGAESFREHYLLHYMLNVETRGSQSLLNVQSFTDPTAYKLKVKRPGSDESGEVNIDLLETFNWLIGLTVQHIAAPQSFIATFERDSEKRLRLNGRLRQEEGAPYWFRTVTGITPDGKKTLIIWRKLSGEPEQDNLVLDEWFRKHTYSTRDAVFDLIYVNGGNNLPNVRRDDETWKVRLIEEDFHRLMFENREGV